MRGSSSPVAVGPLIVGVLAAMVATLTAGCGSRADGSAEHPYRPTLPAIDVRPHLILEVDDGGLRARPGERTDAAVRLDPPTVPRRAVVEVRNAGTTDHRLQGGAALDTGIMRPGERTTVVVGDPAELTLVDTAGAPARPLGPLRVE